MSTAEKGDASSLSPVFYIFAAAVLFSTGGLCFKLTDLTAYQIAGGRSLIAAITVALLTRRAGWRVSGLTLANSVVYAAVLLLFVTANKLTTAANAIFLQYTAPLYVLVLEPLIFKERFRPLDLIVVIGCLGGMSLFFVGQLRPDDVTGNFVALGSGFCFALFTLLLRYGAIRKKNENRAAPVIYGNVLLAVCTAPALFSDVGRVTIADAAILIYLGVFQIGVAYTLFATGIARGVRSLQAGVVGFIEPLLNPLWVFLGVGERPSRYALVGGAIIIGAVLTHTLLGARLRRRAEADGTPALSPD